MMTTVNNVFDDTFRFESARLGEDLTRASGLGKGTPAEIAEHREGAFRALIERFFPSPYHVVKGQILGVNGVRSSSIDCIVLAPEHPHLVDRSGKFTMILADGVDFVIDVKGRLDAGELTRFLVQSASVKKAERSKSPLMMSVRLDDAANKERDIASLRIPTYAYCHETTLSPERLAGCVAAWCEATEAAPLEHPDAIAVHNRGILLDTSNPLSPGRRIYPDAPVGLLWIDSGDLTLGQFLIILNLGIPATPRLADPILSNYASVEFRARCLVGFPP